ncbi:quinone oxidoreductase-like [Centruroides vittatus]|uniref:quinone oxidoreductase-like n=1 Tax=Centruroides vittatus TaxID=120091 RepID=UPI00350FD3A5
MAKVMRAVRILKFGGPKVLQVQNDIPVPSISDNQVLVQIKSAGVNPIDTYIREGASGNPQLPYILGKDGAGIIEAVGKNVKNVKIGDRVFVCILPTNRQGTYAEYVAAEEKEVFPLSEKLTFHQGASIGIPYFTAFRALFLKANAKKGETVLVHGASGSVGLASVQMCKHYGMKTLATAGTSEGMDLVQKNGADYVFCHKDKNYLDEMMKATQSNGVDIILEMLSNVNLGNDLTILAPRGRVMIIGSRGDVVINPRAMMFPETTITGVALMSSSDEEWEKIGSAVSSGLEEGWLNPVVNRIYPLKNVADAHHDIIHSKGAKGNLVLSFD